MCVCVCARPKTRRTFLFCAFQTFAPAPHPDCHIRTTSTNNPGTSAWRTVAKGKRAETKICQSIHYDLKPIKPPCKVGGPRAVCRRNFSWVDTGDGGERGYELFSGGRKELKGKRKYNVWHLRILRGRKNRRGKSTGGGKGF